MPRKSRIPCPHCHKDFSTEGFLKTHIKEFHANAPLTSNQTSGKQSASKPASDVAPSFNPDALYASMSEILSQTQGEMRATDLAKALIAKGNAPSKSVDYLGQQMVKAVKQIDGNIDYNGRGRYSIGTGKVKGKRRRTPTELSTLPKAANRVTPINAETTEVPLEEMDGKTVLNMFLNRDNERMRNVVLAMSQVVIAAVGIEK